VQHVDHVGKADCINCAERIAIMLGDDLKDAGVAKPREYLGVLMLLVLLGSKKGVPDGTADLDWHGGQILLAAGDPAQWFHSVLPLRGLW
jgi:hypothetical protein